MTNLLWYVGLALIGVGIAIFTIIKRRHKFKASTLLIFYMFTACITWIGEFIVLGLFNAYGYKTGVFTDIWAQNLLGHLLMNTTLYPAAAVVMVAYSLRYGWMFSVAAVFTLIEYLFVNLRIYEQHWWRYYMTFLAVIFFLLIFHKWFPKMNQKRYGATRAITYYFVAMLITHLPAPLLLLSGKQYYQLSFVNNWAGNLYLASIIVIFFYHLIESFLLVLFTCIIKKGYLKIIPVIVSIAVQIIFEKMGILIMQDGWKLIYTLVIYEAFIVAYILIEKHTLKPDFYKLVR